MIFNDKVVQHALSRVHTERVGVNGSLVNGALEYDKHLMTFVLRVFYRAVFAINLRYFIVHGHVI